jgi:hypothetical protein
MLIIPCIDNDLFIKIHQQMNNLVFTELYYIKPLKTPTCFDPSGMYGLPDDDHTEIETCTSLMFYCHIAV